MNRFTSLLAICIVLSLSAYAQQWKIQKQGIPEIQYATEDQFGSAMATDAHGNFVVVGAPHEDTGELNSGAAYIYQRINGTYEQIKKLTPSDPSEDKKFGASVAIDDSIIVVGAYADKEGNWYSGAAYIFTKGESGWQDALEIKKLTPHDPAYFGQFGYAVAVNDQTIAIGSIGAFGKEEKKTGAVYVYSKNKTWKNIVYKCKLTCIPNDDRYFKKYHVSQNRTDLGNSVVIGNGFIAASAPYYDQRAFEDGGIFIFNKPQLGWKDATESTILHLSDSLDNAEIGRGLSIRGDLMLTGARGPYRGKGGSMGYAYLFQKDSTGWNEYPIANLEAGIKGTYSYKYSVSLGNEYALLGIPMVYNGEAGGVYIYEKPKSGWGGDASESDRITFSKVQKSSFGYSVLSINDTVLVGAPNDNRPSLAAGSVLQLVRSQVGAWQEENMTRWETPREENASHYTFGDEVAIYENTMVVGAPKDNAYGAAYVYEKIDGSWKKVAKLTAKDGKSLDNFGAAVNVYQDCIVIGAPFYDDQRGSEVGAAYLFEKPEKGWQNMHETAKFTTSDTSSRFGYAVDLTDSFVVVGCDLRFNKGGTYVFEKNNAGMG